MIMVVDVSACAGLVYWGKSLLPYLHSMLPTPFPVFLSYLNLTTGFLTATVVNNINRMIMFNTTSEDTNTVVLVARTFCIP